MAENVHVKIYKCATQRSIMDITSALEYHKEKQNGELEYKGNLVVAITEMGNQKKYEKAFLSKKGAKVLFYSIMNHTFHQLFKNGFVEYGGSRNNGQIRARVFSVKLDQKNRFIFQIDEGVGSLGANGSIQMQEKQKTVQNYVSYEEAQKLAHEVYDFIRESETIALLKGKPYFTILPERTNSSSASQNQEDYNTYDSSTTLEVQQNEEPVSTSNTNNGYIIRIGNWQGKPISSLSTDVLELIISKVEPDTDDKRELIEEARKELATRY